MESTISFYDWSSFCREARDLALLLKIKSFFGCGIIIKNDAQNEVSFRVNSLQDLTNIIIPHFSNYPLLTKKAADFKLFKQVIELMQNKAHLTREGLQKIINIKSSMNLGISDELKFNFINTVPVKRPTIKPNNIPDFNWISGFVSGDGSFFVDIFKSSSGAPAPLAKRWLRLLAAEAARPQIKLDIK